MLITRAKRTGRQFTSGLRLGTKALAEEGQGFTEQIAIQSLKGRILSLSSIALNDVSVTRADESVLGKVLLAWNRVYRRAFKPLVDKKGWN